MNENKDDIKDKIHKFCKGMSYLSTEDINNFTDETLDKIYKEIPMVYTSNYLQEYVQNYILRFIKHVCDHTRIEFNVKNMDTYKTQEEKERELLKEIHMIQDILKKQRIEGEKDEVTNINTESDRARVVTYGRKRL